MPRSLFIHAINVHRGGGRFLLHAILKSLPTDIEFRLCLDSRLSLPKNLLLKNQIRRVPPSIIDRVAAEIWLYKNVEPGDLVLCFGNLPPLFKLHGYVMVFVQNWYLVDDAKLEGFSLKTRLKIGIERLWLSSRMSNVNEFIVQTPSMKVLLCARTKQGMPIQVAPFIKSNEGYARRLRSLTNRKERNYKFLYVASGEPHKNHRQLINAWCMLAKEGIFPSLKLTLDKSVFAELCFWISQKSRQFQLVVDNVGDTTPKKVKKLYSKVDALIYPSTFESLGLPLIEARQAGLPVLSSELDFVRDVLDPEESFNPESAVSIARAVKRFMGIEEQALPLHDAKGFMKHILSHSG